MSIIGGITGQALSSNIRGAQNFKSKFTTDSAEEREVYIGGLVGQDNNGFTSYVTSTNCLFSDNGKGKSQIGQKYGATVGPVPQENINDYICYKDVVSSANSATGASGIIYCSYQWWKASHKGDTGARPIMCSFSKQQTSTIGYSNSRY